MSVYKRGKVFYMNFTVNGVRVFKSTGCTTKREAKAVEAAERHKIQKKSKQTPQEQGAETLLLDAINQVYEQRWSHGKDGMGSYRRAINLSSIIGNIKLSDITETTVNNLTKTLETKGSSTATINRYKASLKTILKQLKQPSDSIKLRKERKGRLRILSREEEVKVVNLLRDRGQLVEGSYYAEVADLVEVLVDTGMRLGEALVLRYENIDFTSGLISIWVNKGDRPRSIPMTKRVKTILAARQAGGNDKPFTLKAHQVSTAWNWCRKKMGLDGDKEFIPHSLRHTCASRLLNRGIDIYVVKEWLGHSTIQVTERYAHLSPHKLADAVSVLED